MGSLEDDAIKALHTVTTGLWRFTCAIGMGVIWRQRQNLLMKTKFVKTGCHAAAATLQLRLRSGLRCFEYLAEKYAGDAEAALAVTKAVIQLFFTHQGEAPRIYEPAPREAFLLYFDGGSRGNPGPGGAGAVIVHIAAGEAVPRLVWVASMAYGNASTTNNYAEYQGLLTGLKAAAARRFSPLHVIGDSQLIINQFREHKESEERQAPRPESTMSAATVQDWLGLVDTSCPGVQQDGRHGSEHCDGHKQVFSTHHAFATKRIDPSSQMDVQRRRLLARISCRSTSSIMDRGTRTQKEHGGPSEATDGRGAVGALTPANLSSFRRSLRWSLKGRIS